MPLTPITYDAMIDHLSWTEAVEALRAGHLLPKAQVADMLLGPTDGTLLSRGAYIEGLGFGVKSVTVFDRNPARGLPAIQGGITMAVRVAPNVAPGCHHSHSEGLPCRRTGRSEN